MPDLRQLVARAPWWLIAIAAAYLYVFPFYPRLQSANELPRVYLVKAIVDDHTFAIDHGVQRWGRTSDLAQWGDHLYSNKAPGSSLLAVPAYALVRWIAGEPSFTVIIWICRIVTGVIPTLLFLWLLWGFLERFTPDPEIRRLVLVAYALGSMAMTYSLLYYSHQLSAVCIGSAWIYGVDFLDRRRGVWAIAVAGFLAGAAVLVDYQTAFAWLPLAAFVMWRLWRWPMREKLRAIALAIAAAAVPIAVLLAYHTACFGSPLRTGYNAAITFASDHDHGLLGMTSPHVAALYGTMLAPDNGFFALAPWWLLAIPGGIALWRRGDRATVLTCTGVAVVFVLFISSIGFWRAGWEVGPRYITAMQPFLLPLVAVALAQWRDRPVLIGAAIGLIVVGLVVYTGSAATFPYWPDALRDPLYEVMFRLFGAGAVAPNLASGYGVATLGAIVPFILGIAALAGWAIVRATSWRSLGIGVIVGALIIVAFAFVPHGGPHAERLYTQTVFPAVTK